MNDEQKKYVLYGAGLILVVCMVSWFVMLFWPKAAVTPALPSLIDATRPQYDYNADSYIQQNPGQFISQLLPLLGSLEAAVQKQDQPAVNASAAMLRKELVRWRDATAIPTLQTSIQRYIDATDALAAGNKAAFPAALTVLNEIKTLALENQRTTLQSLSR